MKKIFLFILLMAVGVFAQQINYTSGDKQSGASWNYAGLVYIDTTSSTTNDIYIDLNDFYWIDSYPFAAVGAAVTGYSHASDSVGLDSISGGAITENDNSSRFYVGTFWCNFDNQGTGSPTTDSLKYTIKAYPGVYTGASKSYANADFGTAVTLQTLAAVNDQFTVNNVYVHATATKIYPPELIKLEIAPVGSPNCDDSTAVYWQFAYPAIYQTAKERK